MSWDVGERGWHRLEGEGTRPAGQWTVAVTEPEPAPFVVPVDLSGPPTLPVEAPFVPVPDQPIVGFARDVLGFDPSPRQAAILSEIYADQIRQAILRLGRRSGKGRIASIVAVYEATVNAPAHLAAVPPGEQVAIVVIATSQRQARIVHRYIRGFLSRPALAKLVMRESEDEIELSNGIVLLTLPCNAASVRGLAVAVVILDEAAWFQGRDGSPLDVSEIFDALEPATAQFPERRTLVLSTPRWATGWFATQCERAASGRFPESRHWHASTAQMNPKIPATFLDGKAAEDPVMFRREYLAEFDSGIAALFDQATVRAAVAERESLPPNPAYTYTVAIDPAYTGDRFALVVGHLFNDRLIVDRVTGWQGSRGKPLDHRQVLDEVAAIATAYGRAKVLLDQYAAEPIAQGLAERGIGPVRMPWRNELKVDAVTTLRQLLYQSRVELPRHAELVAELISLEQHPLPSGRPRIAAPPGGHDDYATALLALAHFLCGRNRTTGPISLVA